MRLLFALAVLAACSGPAKKPDKPPPAQVDKILVNVDADGVGLGGNDPMSYRADDVQFGTAEHASDFGGAKYHFTSADNKAKFEADKAKLAPGYGGYCVFAAAQNRVQKADPSIYVIYEGQLLMFTNRAFKASFQKDPAGNKKQADANWPALVAKHGKPIK